MMRKWVRGFSSCYSHCFNTIKGVPFLRSIFVRNYTNPTESTETQHEPFRYHSPQKIKLHYTPLDLNKIMVSNPTTSDETQNPDVEEALLAFEDYLGMIPRPPLCFFNEAMAYIADLKHYDVVIALFNRMGRAGIPYDIDTINLIFHCYLQLNQDMLAYVFLEQLYIDETGSSI